MLKGIARCIGPDLLAVLHRMGHGDGIILADTHFPAHSVGPQVLRADGITVVDLLDGIPPLFELDSYVPPLVMMEAVTGDTLDPAVEREYLEIVRRHVPSAARPERLERYAFYKRAKTASAIVLTGEMRKYRNLIVKKGVTPVNSIRRGRNTSRSTHKGTQ